MKSHRTVFLNTCLASTNGEASFQNAIVFLWWFCYDKVKMLRKFILYGINHRKENMVSRNNIKHKRGFTIIEVVLVLAIAGLIFLMVFIALPALQRSQRNTQRRDDYSMLVTAVNNYMASNNGKIGNLLKSGATTVDPNSNLDPKRWINSEGLDPNGNPYQIIAYSYRAWESEGSKTPGVSSEDDGQGSQVFIIIKANCRETDANGDPMPSEDTAARAFAVYGYLEGGSVFCQDSGSN